MLYTDQSQQCPIVKLSIFAVCLKIDFSKTCIDCNRVCDLVDNCGDKSDEANCFNHFECDNSEKYIPISRKCDGSLDCFDHSDECNPICSRRNINNYKLRVFAVSVGFLTSLINLLVLLVHFKHLYAAHSESRLVNSAFVLLIAVGDLLIGLYLTTIGIADMVFEDTYCKDRYEWLTDIKCSIIGIINCIGSQLALFSMTLLSIYRVFNLRIVSRPGEMSAKRKIYLAFTTSSIVILSISVIPKLTQFEDYFINGIYYYNVPLFIGAPDKAKHLEVIKEYYGRFKDTFVPWKTIRKFITSMFSSDQYKVNGTSLGFYGNDGVCLFKYFVDKTDPQRMFSLSILILNFCCFLCITICYIMINLASSLSARESTGNAGDNAINRNSQLQKRITLIILTDFLCWVPFITTCLLHFVGVVDATQYYGFFSVIILPINSLINPLIYDNTITTKVNKIYNKMMMRCSNRNNDPE